MHDPWMVLIFAFAVPVVDFAAWTNFCLGVSYFTNDTNWTRPFPRAYRNKAWVPRYLLLGVVAVLFLLSLTAEGTAGAVFLGGSLVALLGYFVFAHVRFWRLVKEDRASK